MLQHRQWALSQQVLLQGDSKAVPMTTGMDKGQTQLLKFAFRHNLSYNWSLLSGMECGLAETRKR